MQFHRVVGLADERDALSHYAPPFVICAVVIIVIVEFAIIGVNVVIVVVVELSVTVRVDAYLALEVSLSIVIAVGRVEHHVLELLLPFDTVVVEDEWGLELLAGPGQHALSREDEIAGSHRVLVNPHAHEHLAVAWKDRELAVHHVCVIC